MRIFVFLYNFNVTGNETTKPWRNSSAGFIHFTSDQPTGPGYPDADWWFLTLLIPSKTYSVLSSPLSLPQSIVAGLVNACHDEQCTVHLPARVIGPWSLWAARQKLLLCSSSCRCCSSSIHSDLPISFLSYSRSLTQDSTARPRVQVRRLVGPTYSALQRYGVSKRRLTNGAALRSAAEDTLRNLAATTWFPMLPIPISGQALPKNAWLVLGALSLLAFDTIVTTYKKETSGFRRCI